MLDRNGHEMAETTDFYAYRNLVEIEYYDAIPPSYTLPTGSQVMAIFLDYHPGRKFTRDVISAMRADWERDILPHIQPLRRAQVFGGQGGPYSPALYGSQLPVSGHPAYTWGEGWSAPAAGSSGEVGSRGNDGPLPEVRSEAGGDIAIRALKLAELRETCTRLGYPLHPNPPNGGVEVMFYRNVLRGHLRRGGKLE